MSGIGSLNEKGLHAALKAWYQEPGDLVEQPIDGFVADLVRDGQIIEIQTRGVSALRRKFDLLLDSHPIRLIHPISETKWIKRIQDDGEVLSRRRSPKRGIPAAVCLELVAFPSLLSHPHFELEVVLVQEEEIRRPDPKAWRRNGWGVAERTLLEVGESTVLDSPVSLLGLLPTDLPEVFTTADLATGLKRTRHDAQTVAYCLRISGAAEEVGRDHRGILYRLPPSRGTAD